MSHLQKKEVNSKYAAAFARCYFCEKPVQGLNLVGIDAILHNACVECGEKYEKENSTKPEDSTNAK
jgi:translation initiation factor 2 beta subunit (eIF-2beta)/eIF-5